MNSLFELRLLIVLPILDDGCTWPYLNLVKALGEHAALVMTLNNGSDGSAMFLLFVNVDGLTQSIFGFEERLACIHAFLGKVHRLSVNVQQIDGSRICAFSSLRAHGSERGA